MRDGDPKVIQLLLDNGADINARTKHGEAGASGGTPLWWAMKYHNEDDEVIKLLKNNGAKSIAPKAKKARN